MILITTPGFRWFGALNRRSASQSRANGDGHNCVPNKERADFPPVLESDHTIGLAAYLKAVDSLARAAAPDSHGLIAAAKAFPSGMWELRHITLPRIGLQKISSLDCDPPQMTGPFFEKRRPPPRLARALAPIGRPTLDSRKPNPHQRAS